MAAKQIEQYREGDGGNDLDLLYEKALQLYRTRILDSVDLDRLPDLKARAAVVARALIDRGDARAFAMGRQILDLVQKPPAG